MNDIRFTEYCAHCRKGLQEVAKIYFVEKEIGRCFCCEQCIHDYFEPVVSMQHEEYVKLRLPDDFTDEAIAKLDAYKQATLSEPDEVWVQKNETGDLYYTFISRFEQHGRRFSYVCVALVLEGEPSYLLLSFATKDDNLVDLYRRGDDLKIELGKDAELGEEFAEFAEDLDEEDTVAEEHSAESTEFERICREYRKSTDISLSDFLNYESFVEPSLEDPDEIWTRTLEDGRQWCTFIAKFSGDEKMPFSMIVICMPVKNGNSKTLEVAYAFPTNDSTLVQQFRQGLNAMTKSYNSGFGRAA